MQRRITLLLALFVLAAGSAFAQNGSGTLKGKVTDKDNKEPLPFVVVQVFLNGNLVTGATTDIDGEYTIKPIDPGTYDLQISFVGYQTQALKGIPVSSGKIAFANAELTSGVELNTVEIVDYKVPLIDKDGGASGGTVTREEIKNMPGRSALGLATTVAGVSTAGTGGEISIRGARTGSTWVYIDGMKVRGSASSLPKSAVEEVSVITGGIPANIGDVTGGVINISLRSASSKYTGGVEVISSGFKSGDKAVGLDSYGYNLVEGTLSGPIIFKKDKDGKKTRPLLGFFVTGNFTSSVDPSPAYGGAYKIKDSALQGILNNPLRQNIQSDGTVNGALYNANFLTSDSFEKTKTNLNIQSTRLNMVTKFDLNLTESITLTVGGTYGYRNGHDFGDAVSGVTRINTIMNWQNNSQGINNSWRTYVKFSQRFKNAEGEEAKNSNLKNVFYSVMVDYSSITDKTQDDSHKDDLFKYGHIGKFDLYQGNSYEWNDTYFKQNGITDIGYYFTPSEYNQDLSAITNQYFQLFDRGFLNTNAITATDGSLIHDRNEIFLNDPGVIAAIGADPYASRQRIQGTNGLFNGDTPADVYGLWNYPGSQTARYEVKNQNQFRVSASGSADIGKHALQVGFEFEQRNDAGFAVSPIGLWTMARQYTNFHLSPFSTNPTDSTRHRIGNYDYYYYDVSVGDNQREFDYNLRTSLGKDPRGGEYINIDNLDPSALDIHMFGAEDLLNQGSPLVTYFGYSHSGDRMKKTPTFDDFFSETYKLGGKDFYTRSVGSFQPIYIAGYIMDKFAFDDLIFNVGVRIDRYDANQFVPKDPYVISEAYSASEVDFSDKFPGYTKPSNIGDGYVVYVNDKLNPTFVTGYRNGDTWYDASGKAVDTPAAITAASGNKAIPFLKVDPSLPLTKSTFKEYNPAVNIMPRVALSFPISDEALFFAHYDILTQRPFSSGFDPINRINPVDYLYLAASSNSFLNNPNLRPERTVDYALGFQQILSRTSSIKVEAFYRELRDQVQVRSYTGAYPNNYRTYANQDFGTVKGLTLTYDMRKTGNFWLKASYTLQFADGTGSTTSTQLALINAGLPNLRSINPFNYDQRHRFVATMDYRYADGKDYNGPVWFGKQVFANCGVNLIANLGSGTPYTAQQFATPVTGEVSPSTDGTLNGSRLPWQFTVDANLDRNFTLKFGKDDNKKKETNLNVYIWVTNLLNTKNIVGVHRYTGTPDNDGYLAAARYQTLINSQVSPDSFRNYYAMRVNDPYNIGAPRQIRLGIRFDF